MLLAPACSSSDDSTATSSINTVLPDPTVPAPGECDAVAESLDTPSIVIDGTETDATLGTASWNCGTLTGEGFITFVYNPVLLDADGPIEVRVDGDAQAELSWPKGTAFSQTGSGVWQSDDPTTGCGRLIIRLASTSGLSTAVYGADIRVGGGAIACPQRELDPSDPDITETPEPVFPTDTASTDPKSAETETTDTESTDTESTGSSTDGSNSTETIDN